MVLKCNFKERIDFVPSLSPSPLRGILNIHHRDFLLVGCKKFIHDFLRFEEDLFFAIDSLHKPQCQRRRNSLESACDAFTSSLAYQLSAFAPRRRQSVLNQSRNYSTTVHLMCRWTYILNSYYISER